MYIYFFIWNPNISILISFLKRSIVSKLGRNTESLVIFQMPTEFDYLICSHWTFVIELKWNKSRAHFIHHTLVLIQCLCILHGYSLKLWHLHFLIKNGRALCCDKIIVCMRLQDVGVRRGKKAAPFEPTFSVIRLLKEIYQAIFFKLFWLLIFRRTFSLSKLWFCNLFEDCMMLLAPIVYSFFDT